MVKVFFFSLSSRRLSKSVPIEKRRRWMKQVTTKLLPFYQTFTNKKYIIEKIYTHTVRNLKRATEHGEKTRIFFSSSVAHVTFSTMDIRAPRYTSFTTTLFTGKLFLSLSLSVSPFQIEKNRTLLE